MRFKVGDKVYTSVSIDEVSLRHMMVFNRDAAEFGVTWGDIERIANDPDEPQGNDQFLLMAVTVWLAMLDAGEDMSFSQACEVKLSDLDILPDPEDRKPGKSKGAKKPRKSTPPSAPAESPADDAAEPTTSAPQESESPSTAASSS